MRKWPNLQRITDPDDAPVYTVHHNGTHIATIRQRYGVWLLVPPGSEILAAATDLDRLVSKAFDILGVNCT